MQTEVISEGVDNFEQAAREIGQRWGVRMKTQYAAQDKTMGSWPGTLEEARRLVDSTFGVRLADEERELLALLVERGARRAWHARL
jgi:hypothetical protein